MKLSTTRWTRQSLLTISLALSIALLASCVSAKPLPEAAPAEAMEKPQLIADLRIPPSAPALELALPLPSAPAVVARAALSATQAPAPNEIRAASPSGPDSPALSGAMDEPPVPQKAAEAAPKAPAAASPAAQAPAAKAPAQAPVQSPGPAAKAPAAVPAPAPAVAAPPAAASTTAPKAAASSPAPNAGSPGASYSLPSAPTSSTRSVEAAPAPVAEIRVDAVRGERFELRFSGSGWTYLGDEDSKDGMRYETRRFEGNEAIFSLRPEKSDDYLLRFQRQDPVSGARQSSLVRVSVREPGTKKADDTGTASTQAPARTAASGAPATTAGVPAPAGTTAAAAAPPSSAGSASAIAGGGMAGSASLTASESGTAQAGTPIPSSQANEALLAISEPSALLSYARTELDAKRVRAALDALDRYIELFKRGSDELFYLYGLAYEQDTPFRDIKLSYASYKRVRDEYPRSTRWKAAAERVAYLERHYYGLR